MHPNASDIFIFLLKPHLESIDIGFALFFFFSLFVSVVTEFPVLSIKLDFPSSKSQRDDYTLNFWKSDFRGNG